MALVTARTVENKKVLVWTHRRMGKAVKSSQSKFSIVVNGCRIEYLLRPDQMEGNFRPASTWCRLTFMDPFTDKMVTVKRRMDNFQILEAAQGPSYGVRGFEGFVDKVKRPAKKPKMSELAKQLAKHGTDVQRDDVYNALTGQPTYSGIRIPLEISPSPQIPADRIAVKFTVAREASSKYFQPVDIVVPD